MSVAAESVCACAGPEEGTVTMALGSTIPASLYTLPRLWAQLKADSQYTKRQAQVEEFNRSSLWLKRGISITPCRSASVTPACRVDACPVAASSRCALCACLCVGVAVDTAALWGKQIMTLSAPPGAALHILNCDRCRL